MGRISPTLTAESPRTPTARIPRTEARAGMAMSLATFAMAAASAIQAVLYLSLFGATEQTDGFFVAFAVYTTFGVFSQSLRLTSVPLLIEPGARLTVRRVCGGPGPRRAARPDLDRAAGWPICFGHRARPGVKREKRHGIGAHGARPRHGAAAMGRRRRDRSGREGELLRRRHELHRRRRSRAHRLPAPHGNRR